MEYSRLNWRKEIIRPLISTLKVKDLAASGLMERVGWKNQILMLISKPEQKVCIGAAIERNMVLEILNN